MRRTAKTTISRSDYYTLVGLFELAREYNRAVEHMAAAAVAVTGESDLSVRDYGLTGDMLYGDDDVDGLLRKLGITVEDD